MTGDQAIIALIEALEGLNIPYMVVGSLSTNFYGISRSTNDADFVVQLEDTALAAIAQRLGDQFRLDPQASFERVTGTTRYIIQPSGTLFKIELFLLSDDPHDQQRFARRRRGEVADREAFLPHVEDVIITKLRWAVRSARSKDADDVRDVISLQQEFLDWNYIYSWCDKHGTREKLDEIRRSVPLI